MSGGFEAFRGEYLEALRAHLETGDEATLSAAYELGRRALAAGLGVLDMLAIHQHAVRELASVRPSTPTEEAEAAFLRDLLSPFEMTFRGYRDANEDLRRLNIALAREKEATEEANRELESFSYSVSHDLRAPLRSIDGFSQALLEDYDDKLDPQGRKYLRHVRESAQHMARLIDALLSLARVTRGEVRRTAVDLSATVRRILARHQEMEPTRIVETIVQDSVICEGDPQLLKIALENLLGNAWKFTARREHAKIEFGTIVDGTRIIYEVRDNGAGFDMKYVGKLFGAFQRLHTADQFEGTGIGLATVQRIIHRHAGEVWADAVLEQGATFRFTIGEER